MFFVIDFVLLGISAGLSLAERRNRWNLRPLYHLHPLCHLLPRPHPAAGFILTPRHFLLSCVPPFCLPLSAVSARPCLCDPVQSSRLPMWVLISLNCRARRRENELRAMICRKWRGSEKEKEEKKGGKRKAQQDVDFTQIEIVNRSRQSHSWTKAVWLGVCGFGLNMQFSEFESGRIP